MTRFYPFSIFLAGKKWSGHFGDIRRSLYPSGMIAPFHIISSSPVSQLMNCPINCQE